MIKKMSYLILIMCIFLSPLFSYSTNQINNLDSILVSFSKDKSLQNASFSIYAVDINKKEAIISINPNLSLTPASVTKLVTTATAIEELGADYKFETNIKYSGTIKNGVLNGDIYIEGGGDPSLGSNLFKGTYYNPNFLDVWASAIKDVGITKIEGAVIANDLFFEKNPIPSTWIWGDMGNYFGAFPSGLSIYDNTYSIYFNSGSNVGDSVIINKIEPASLKLEFDNQLTSSAEDKDMSTIYGAPYSNYRYITGSIPKGSTNYIVKGSIPNPPLLAAMELSRTLNTNGIICTNSPSVIKKGKNTYINICVTKSPKLSDIIYWTNIKSINLYAETLCNHIGIKSGYEKSYVGGTKAIVKFWSTKNISIEGVNLNDGSGLSRYNTLTTRFLVDILLYMNTSINKDYFKKSLPIAGRTGSLSNMCKGTFAENNLQAKSGYLTRVRSYAGYTKTKSGKEVAFAIIVNNYNCSANEMKNKLEQIMISIANY